MKKTLILSIICLSLLLSTTSCGFSPSSSYPSKDIKGIIQWGEGGGTDTLMRPLSALAEGELGVKIVCSNMTGATGSIATNYVYNENADGYTLLMGAENAPLYKLLGISDIDYSNFKCVYLIGDETVGLVVSKSSPYKSLTQLIDDAVKNPGTIKLSTTGTGGLPWEVSAFITSVTGATFNQIPYDSDASALTAVLNGECDFTVCKLQQGLPYAQAGDINYISMFSKTRSDALPEVPSILEDYPGFEEFLPWGPFYGIFVKEGTDEKIIESLSVTFKKAGEDSSYKELLSNRNVNFLGLIGSEAEDYIKNYSISISSALEEAGAIK